MSAGLTPVSDTKRPHALYIAWGFPPSRGSGVYRALASANALVEGGFDVTVLTCERDTFQRFTGTDPTLEAQIDPRIHVVRIPFELPQHETDIRRWPRQRARNPLEWRERRNREDLEDFPEVMYGPWRGPLVAAAEEINRRRPVDLTLATANPNVDVEAAHTLYRRHGVPFVLDQRDAWSLDVFSETRSEDPRVLEREAAYMRDAQECWFVNDAIAHWHAEQYPAAAARIHTVSNGYDEAFAPRPRSAPAPGDRPLRFGYIGTVTRAMPLASLVSGWQLAHEQGDELRNAEAQLWGYLGFYAAQDEALAQTLARAEASGLRYCGSVPRAGLAEVYDGFDVLLLVLGSGRFVTSGKVFEYMASALPIVSVHAPGIEAERVLAGYPLWFRPERFEAPAIAESLIAAGRAARAVDVDQRRACVEYAGRWERRRQLRPRIAALRAGFGEGRS